MAGGNPVPPSDSEAADNKSVLPSLCIAFNNRTARTFSEPDTASAFAFVYLLAVLFRHHDDSGQVDVPAALLSSRTMTQLWTVMCSNDVSAVSRDQIAALQQCAATLLSHQLERMRRSSGEALDEWLRVRRSDVREFCRAAAQLAQLELRPAASEPSFGGSFGGFGAPPGGGFGRPSNPAASASKARLNARTQVLLQLVMNFTQAQEACTVADDGPAPGSGRCVLLAMESASALSEATNRAVTVWQQTGSLAARQADVLGVVDTERTRNRQWPYDATVEDITQDLLSRGGPGIQDIVLKARGTFVRICRTYNGGNMQRDILVHTFLGGDSSWREQSMREYDALFELSNPGYGEGEKGTIRAPSTGFIDMYDAVYLESCLANHRDVTQTWWDWAMRRRRNHADGRGGDGGDEPERPPPATWTKPYVPAVDGVTYGCHMPGFNPHQAKAATGSSDTGSLTLYDPLQAPRCFRPTGLLPGTSWDEFSRPSARNSGKPLTAPLQVWPLPTPAAATGTVLLVAADGLDEERWGALRQVHALCLLPAAARERVEARIGEEGRAATLAFLCDSDFEDLRKAAGAGAASSLCGDVLRDACTPLSVLRTAGSTPAAQPSGASTSSSQPSQDLLVDMRALHAFARGFTARRGDAYTRLPVGIAARAWLDAVHKVETLRRRSAAATGWEASLSIPDAAALGIKFDARSAIAGGTLELEAAGGISFSSDTSSRWRVVRASHRITERTADSDGVVHVPASMLQSDTLVVRGDALLLRSYQQATHPYQAAAALPHADGGSGDAWGVSCTAVGLGLPAAAALMRVVSESKRYEADVMKALDPDVWSATADAQLLGYAAACGDPSASQSLWTPAPAAADAKTVYHHMTGLEANFDAEYPALAGIPAHILRLRLALVKEFNAQVVKCAPVLQLDGHHASPLSRLVARLKHVLQASVKQPLLQAALQATKASGVPRISGVRIMRGEDTDVEGKTIRTSKGIFVQLFEFLKAAQGGSFCLDDPHCFNVVMVNDEAVDAGGVYRDTINRCIEELCSRRLDLFTQPFENACYIPNVAYMSGEDAELATSMLEVVGRLMGLSIRTRASLPFTLPALLWRMLLGEEPTVLDLEGAFPTTAARARAVQEWQAPSDTPDVAAAFAAAFPDLTMPQGAATSGDESAAAAEQPGSALQQPHVTFDQREEYCRRVVGDAVQGLVPAVAALRRGMGNVVPLRVLAGFLTWRELELLVCGSPEINLEDLRAHTTYGHPYDSNHPVIVMFWKALESLRPEERSLYWKFVSGSTRLPPTEAAWRALRSHRVIPPVEVTAASVWPHAHTCNVQLELWDGHPSVEHLAEHLLISIHQGLKAGFGMH